MPIEEFLKNLRNGSAGGHLYLSARISEKAKAKKTPGAIQLSFTQTAKDFATNLMLEGFKPSNSQREKMIEEVLGISNFHNPDTGVQAFKSPAGAGFVNATEDLRPDLLGIIRRLKREGFHVKKRKHENWDYFYVLKRELEGRD